MLKKSKEIAHQSLEKTGDTASVIYKKTEDKLEDIKQIDIDKKLTNTFSHLSKAKDKIKIPYKEKKQKDSN